MARVVPVGPIDPELYAFAKKEAEKAERNPRYVPKKRETPAHTVFYRRAGATVKAFVIDKIAPITFSSPGSAIPINPSFLHLHPALSDKPNHLDNSSTGSGRVGWDIATNSGYALIGGTPFGASADIAAMVDGSVSYAIGYPTILHGAQVLWDRSKGEFPIRSDAHHASWSFGWPGSDQAEWNLGASVTRTYFHAVVKAEYTVNHFNFYEVTSIRWTGMGAEAAATNDSHTYSMVYEANAYGVFLDRDIRQAANDFSSSIVAREMQVAASTQSASNENDYVYNTSASAKYAVQQNMHGTYIVPQSACVAFDGGVLFPCVDVSSSWSLQADHTYINIYEWGYAGKSEGVLNVRPGVLKNLLPGTIAGRTTLKDSKTDAVTSSLPFGDQSKSANGVLDKNLFIPASVGGVDGIFISAKVYESWHPSITKKVYSNDAPLIKHRLAGYFGISEGVYQSDDPVHLSPPTVIADGICLPHAWYFSGSNMPNDDGTIDKNNRRHITVVLYPPNKHQFQVDEAEIFSVELKHAPSFVARPGETVQLSMYAVRGGSPLVPYTVRGLIKERDESGKETGFYLAGDGEISGVFESAPDTDKGLAEFKLSPRQKLDEYRLISVETATERLHGARAHIEVFGASERVPPGPPSITLEVIEPSVLAGQYAHFHITTSHIADGSRIKYEVKCMGEVISTGYVYIAYGVGVVDFSAPYKRIEAATPGYVLVEPPARTDEPTVQNYELSLIHGSAPEPVGFSVKYAHEIYPNIGGLPEALPLPSVFYLDALVVRESSGVTTRTRASESADLIRQIWCSIKSKRVYVTFWDGKSCEVSNILKKNPESGKYEFNPDWKEVPFDYPPAVDPYEIKGTLEPYVYAYMDYEASLTGE